MKHPGKDEMMVKYFRASLLIVMTIFFASGCVNMAGPIHQAKNSVFEGTSKPMEQLINEHPQIESHEWSMGENALGQEVVVCAIHTHHKYGKGLIRLTFHVGKRTASLLAITYGGDYSFQSPGNVTQFLWALETKNDLSLGGYLRPY